MKSEATHSCLISVLLPKRLGLKLKIIKFCQNKNLQNLQVFFEKRRILFTCKLQSFGMQCWHTFTILPVQIQFVQTKSGDIVEISVEVGFPHKGETVFEIEIACRIVCGNHIQSHSLHFVLLRLLQTEIQHDASDTLSVKRGMRCKGMYHEIVALLDFLAPLDGVVVTLRVGVEYKRTDDASVFHTGELCTALRRLQCALLRRIGTVPPLWKICVICKVQSYLVVKFAHLFCHGGRTLNYFHTAPPTCFLHCSTKLLFLQLLQRRFCIICLHCTFLTAQKITARNKTIRQFFGTNLHLRLTTLLMSNTNSAFCLRCY